ncbi:hypothetical protein V6N12_002086 [Hibiscus sabdariffa]|uniref:Uncharacterized protein n=1 Tax=Hibiscus sabdariffa TaxID=183260 RepID=A0ABR2AP80_9ROSI
MIAEGGLILKHLRIVDSIAIRSSNLDVVGSDQDTVAADVLAGICGSFSSEAMDSCITWSTGPGGSYHHDWKCHKVDSVVKRHSTFDVVLNFEEDTCSGDSRNGCPCPATSSSLPVEEPGKACGEQKSASGMIPRPAFLKIDTCADALVENLPVCNGVKEEVNDDVEEGDIDSSGTTTSKLVEPLSLEKAVSPSDIVKFHECSGDLGSVQLTTMEVVILATGSGNDGTATTISVEGSLLKKIDNDATVLESSRSGAGGENIMYEMILATNKELANVASEVFCKQLPKDFCGVDVACTQSDTAIREKISMFYQGKF